MKILADKTSFFMLQIQCIFYATLSLEQQFNLGFPIISRFILILFSVEKT